MNRLAIAASMIAVSVSRAPAADLPTQLQTKAPLMAPGFRWSGFYIGGSGQGMLTSDAGAQDWLTGLLFHGRISRGRGISSALSAECHNKAAYRRRAGQSGFRQSAKNVFIGTAPEQRRAAERKGEIGILAGGGLRSDRLAA